MPTRAFQHSSFVEFLKLCRISKTETRQKSFLKNQIYGQKRGAYVE